MAIRHPVSLSSSVIGYVDNSSMILYAHFRFFSVAGEPQIPQSMYFVNVIRGLRLHRATWTSTELFLTFPPPKLLSISLRPLNSDETSGRFRVWLYVSEEQPANLLWDRKVEGGFPELKVLVSVYR